MIARRCCKIKKKIIRKTFKAPFFRSPFFLIIVLSFIFSPLSDVTLSFLGNSKALNFFKDLFFHCYKTLKKIYVMRLKHSSFTILSIYSLIKVLKDSVILTTLLLPFSDIFSSFSWFSLTILSANNCFKCFLFSSQ